MTQQKKVTKPSQKKVTKPSQKKDSKESTKIDLRSKFFALTATDQQRITHFFNMHNAAGFCYDQMSNEAKEYTNYCIQLSQEQKEEGAQES